MSHRLDKEDIVDATKTGGMARFMNHCCEPNAYARVISTADQTAGREGGAEEQSDDKHIVIIAARDIQVRPMYLIHHCCHDCC